MRRASLLPLLCLIGLPASAAAEPEWHVTGLVGVVSDYRWRGVSLTEGDPALQGQVAAERPDGVYVSLGASNVSDWREDPAARRRGKLPFGHGQGLELTASLGRAFEIGETRVDVGLTRYGYPGGRPGYLELPLSVGRSFGPANFSAGLSWAPPQPGTGGQGDRYVWLQAAWAPPGWRLQPRASIGRESIGSAPAKLDWSAGGATQLGRIGLSLDYVGADQGAGSTVVAAIQRRF